VRTDTNQLPSNKICFSTLKELYYDTCFYTHLPDKFILYLTGNV